jgi:adenylate cyclase
LRPEYRSKAERGYRLLLAAPSAPVYAGASPLKTSDSPRQAFRKIALVCLAQFQGNEDGVQRHDDPEFIHQMRVALRRLRSALRIFSPILPEGFGERFAAPLRDLGATVGTVRDWDVLTQEILPPVGYAFPADARLGALVAAAERERATAREAVRATLASLACGRLLLDFLLALHDPAFDAESGGPDLPGFADEALKTLRQNVRKRAERAASLDSRDVHRLRIAGKRLRYALDHFLPLYADSPMRRKLARLAELQTTLGHINDVANASRLLTGLAGSNRLLHEAVVIVEGWQRARLTSVMATLPKRLTSLKAGKYV